jgi:hypothetical protein
MSDQAPKSAFDIAMERLREKDLRDGVEYRPRTDEQKAEIAEIRSVYDAKLAQLDVMHASAMASSLEPGLRAELEQNHRRERERLTGERDHKVERARRSTP